MVFHPWYHVQKIYTPSLNRVNKDPSLFVYLDILGPVSQTYKGNKYILVVTDYFTRFAEAYSLPDIEATTVADKLLTELTWCFTHGIMYRRSIRHH
jgi:hypothetical protein